MSAGDLAALKAALLKVEGNRPDILGISTQWHRNPEGPQAWAVIEAAQAEIGTLRAELAGAREAALDEAAKVAEAMAHNVALDAMRIRYGDEACEHASNHLGYCATAIRALKAAQP